MPLNGRSMLRSYGLCGDAQANEGGGEAAHLTIVSRGLGLPCVMRAQLDRPPRVGERIDVGGDGSITLGPA